MHPKSQAPQHACQVACSPVPRAEPELFSQAGPTACLGSLALVSSAGAVRRRSSTRIRSRQGSPCTFLAAWRPQGGQSLAARGLAALAAAARPRPAAPAMQGGERLQHTPTMQPSGSPQQQAGLCALHVAQAAPAGRPAQQQVLAGASCMLCRRRPDPKRWTLDSRPRAGQGRRLTCAVWSQLLLAAWSAACWGQRWRPCWPGPSWCGGDRAGGPCRGASLAARTQRARAAGRPGGTPGTRLDVRTSMPGGPA